MHSRSVQQGCSSHTNRSRGVSGLASAVAIMRMRVAARIGGCIVHLWTLEWRSGLREAGESPSAKKVADALFMYEGFVHSLGHMSLRA